MSFIDYSDCISADGCVLHVTLDKIEGKVIPFTDETLQYCHTKWKIRESQTTKSKYSHIVLPKKADGKVGYHRYCYKYFGAIGLKKPKEEHNNTTKGIYKKRKRPTADKLPAKPKPVPIPGATGTRAKVRTEARSTPEYLIKILECSMENQEKRLKEFVDEAFEMRSTLFELKERLQDLRKAENTIKVNSNVGTHIPVATHFVINHLPTDDDAEFQEDLDEVYAADTSENYNENVVDENVGDKNGANVNKQSFDISDLTYVNIKSEPNLDIDDDEDSNYNIDYQKIVPIESVRHGTNIQENIHLKKTPLSCPYVRPKPRLTHTVINELRQIASSATGRPSVSKPNDGKRLQMPPRLFTMNNPENQEKQKKQATCSKNFQLFTPT